MKGCGKYNAGQMRDVCRFEREVRTPDGAGGWVSTWQTLAGSATRCDLQRLSGNERWQAMRVDATINAKLICREFPGLTEADRVVCDGRIWNIRYIGEEGIRPKWYELMLEGGVAT